jgi:putative transposase
VYFLIDRLTLEIKEELPMPGKAAKVTITERQQDVLQAFTRRSTCAQRLVTRSKMILLAFEGLNNESIATRLNCERHPVGVWRRRWQKAFDRLISVECNEDRKTLEREIEKVLSDEPRSGTCKKFSPEQVAKIVAVACESPEEEANRPVTHWTPTELAMEVVNRGIVDSISSRHVGRFLKYGRLKTTSGSVLAQSETI